VCVPSVHSFISVNKYDNVNRGRNSTQCYNINKKSVWLISSSKNIDCFQSYKNTQLHVPQYNLTFPRLDLFQWEICRLQQDHYVDGISKLSGFKKYILS